ncbi:MAG: hypothetical protein AB1486_28200 [Planctomycetota bacterium]
MRKRREQVPESTIVLAPGSYTARITLEDGVTVDRAFEVPGLAPAEGIIELVLDR